METVQKNDNQIQTAPEQTAPACKEERIVFYDGECVLCNSSVDLIIKRDKGRKFKHAAIQGKTAEELLPGMSMEDKLSGVILYDRGRIFQGPAAIFRISVILYPVLYPTYWFYLLYPFRWIFNGLYRLIALNRYKWFGKYDVCKVPSPELRKYYIID